MLLTAAAHKIQLVTSTTANLDVHGWYADLVSGAVTVAPIANLSLAAATTTDLVTGAASTSRKMKYLSLRNRHASTANTVTVKLTDGTTVPESFSAPLAAGEHLIWQDNVGWKKYDANGAEVSVSTPGRLLSTTVLTSGTSFTTGAGTNKIKVRMVGGGGGGAGCTSVASAASAGGGGGAGGYAEKLFAVSPSTAYTYAIGAAGAANSGAAGGNGGDTTFAVGATTVTAKGGTGAVVATALTTVVGYAGGAGGVVGTNGDVNRPGEPGLPGIQFLVATPIVASGVGGSGPFGAGGVGLAAVGAGNAGLGNGSGGGGAATGASTVRTGGAGTAGMIVVEEYS